MSVERYTLDANILFYAVDADSGYKHGIAEAIVDVALHSDCILTLQSLGEVYNAISHRKPRFRDAAEELVYILSNALPVATASSLDLAEALREHRQRPIQFWDTLLWATARRHGCKTILTEDAQDRPIVGGVRYLNPLAASSADVSLYLRKL